MPYYNALSDQMVCRIKKWITQIRSQGKTENIDHSEFMREIHLTDSRTCLHDYVIRMGTGAKDNGEKKRVKNEMEKYNAMVAHQLSLIWAIPESNNFSWGVFP